LLEEIIKDKKTEFGAGQADGADMKYIQGRKEVQVRG
jgi:hypothetical protein